MEDRLKAVAAIFDSNAKLFRGTMADMTETAWFHRPGDANHLAFLAMHLVGARHYTVKFSGGASTDPLEVYHGGARSIDSTARFPSVDEVSTAWDEVAPILQSTLAGVSGEFLDQASGLPFPAPGPARLDALTFLAQHEAYHLGQMALLRRICGLPAPEWR